MERHQGLPFIVAALALSLAACGGSSNDDNPPTASPASQSSESQASESQSSASESSSDASESSSSVSESSSSSESSSASSEAVDEPTTYPLYENGLSEQTFRINGADQTATLQPGAYSPGEPVVLEAAATGADGETVWGIQFNATTESNAFLQTVGTVFRNGLIFNEAMRENGALEFDLWIEAIDEATDLVVKIDSGWPNLSEYTLETPEAGQWTSFSLPISDFVANTRGDGVVNFDDISNPFVLEAFGGTAIVQLNNIRYHCDTGACEIDAVQPPPAIVSDQLDIFAGDLAPPFTELGAFASEVEITNIPNSDLGAPALQFSFSASAATDGVYITSQQGAQDLSAFEGGNVVFELKVINAADNTDGFSVKADHDGGSSGDLSVPLPDNNDWNTITIPVDQLTSTGLDLSLVTAPFVVFPVFDQQANLTFQVGNIRWEAAAEE